MKKIRSKVHKNSEIYEILEDIEKTP
jgi:hypothetical protein